MSLRVLSYNIRFGGRGREDLLASVINACKPDVVVLQEAVYPEVIERLATACSMKQWGAMRGHSLGFLSRIENVSANWHHTRFARRAYLELWLPDAGVRIFGVHLSAIHSNLTERRRVYELRSLLRGISEHQHGFHLIAGDFNTLAPGELLDLKRLPRRLRALAWMSGGRIRWKTIQLMLDAGYADGYQKLHLGDPGYTFPTRDPHVRLDYMFAPQPAVERLVSCEIVKSPSAVQASDHFPLLGEIAEGV